jgi:colicin import membrane protein
VVGMSETPFGEPPARGGRVRVHADAADRARAWRERRQAERAAAADSAGAGAEAAGPGGEPLIAAAGLALAVDQLRQIAATARAQLTGEVDRIEAAVEVLADPDAIDRALAGARAEADRRVAEADAARVAALDEAATARRRAAAENQRAADAVAAADEAWVQVDELAGHRETLQVDLAAAAAQLEQTRAELTAAREQLALAVAAAREEGREEGRRDAQQRHDADLALDRARAEGQLAVLQARLDAATELAADRAAQLSRLRDTPPTPPTAAAVPLAAASTGRTSRGRPRRAGASPPDASPPGDGAQPPATGGGAGS